MTLVLSCIAVIFVISSLPLHIFFTITDLGLVSMPSPSSYFFSLGLCHAFAMSSCVSNPVLYGWFNTNLRKEFVKVKLTFSTKSQSYLFPSDFTIFIDKSGEGRKGQ